MDALKKHSIAFFLSFIFFTTCQAQLFTKLGQFHNQFFVGIGYSECFGNVSYGLNHSRYFKRLKRDIVGILDFSLPLYGPSYTRFVFRKGFQFDIFKKNNFKLPVAIISSSISKSLLPFSFHDVTTGVSFLPGIYKDKFTLAFNVGVDFLLYRKVHYKNTYKQGDANPDKKRDIININAGIVFAYNVKRFSFIFKGGFQQLVFWEFAKAPVYAVAICAFNLNFRKHLAEKSN